MNFSEQNQALQIAKPYRLQWEEAQGQYVLLYPEGMISLNETAAEILKACSESKKFQQIVKELADQYQVEPQALEGDIEQFLQVAFQQGWITSVNPLIPRQD